MSQLPIQRWNSSTVLNIITADNDISCAGITLKGLHCRWDLGGDPKMKARNLLNTMSQGSPLEALDLLPQLARLCLCQKNHQQQAAEVVARWTALIESYAKEDTRRSHRPVAREGNKGSMPSNGRVHATWSSGPEVNLDEVIAELNALTIRQEELRLILRDADPGNEHKYFKDGSARTSPSQNTSYLGSQTQLSELELPKAGQDQRRGSSSSREGWKRVFARGKHPN